PPALHSFPTRRSSDLAGVTRVSLGVQSFRAAKLETLERDHRPEQIFAAYEQARSFAHSVSLDLIFAAPRETLQQWRQDLEATVSDRKSTRLNSSHRTI